MVKILLISKNWCFLNSISIFFYALKSSHNELFSCVFYDVYINKKTDIIRGSDYDRFMKSLTGYKKEGGNKHDDAPDGLTILAEYVEDIGLYRTMNKKTVDRRAVI